MMNAITQIIFNKTTLYHKNIINLRVTVVVSQNILC